MIIALGLALVGALVAVVGTKVLLGMTGFVAGGGIAALVLQHLTIDTALMMLSSLAGSCLLVASAERFLEISPSIGTVLIIVLAAVGILIQARLWRRRRPIKREV